MIDPASALFLLIGLILFGMLGVSLVQGYRHGVPGPVLIGTALAGIILGSVLVLSVLSRYQPAQDPHEPILTCCGEHKLP